MARSRRKTPICGMCSTNSEKKDKQIANRRLRHKVKQADLTEDDVAQNLVLRAVHNIWSGIKDGKLYFKYYEKKYPEDYKKMMRK